ncbi:MAG: phosphoribosylformylglycinamidine synthase [Wolbachia endosymbiont of Menacanthus eurysternus]|nr:MAG: phosphoribosylformylglycinamidine synthase [Wolbachia endosymbiont of Menacanthus eurysternus]
MTNIRIEILNKHKKNSNKWFVNVYSIYMSIKLSSKLYENICKLFYNETVQNCRYYFYNESLEEVKYSFIEPRAEWGLEINFLPNIVDNVGNTVKQIIKEYLISKHLSITHSSTTLKCNAKTYKLQYQNLEINEKNTKITSFDIAAKSSKLVLGNGNLPENNTIEFNPMTEYSTLIYKEKNGNFYWKKHYKKQNFISIPNNTVKTNNSQCSTNQILKNNTITATKFVNLDVSDYKLKKLSKYGINGNGTLGLSLIAMKSIKNYFKKLGRNPYDIELESLAQTWSEHCKHNIFCSPIDEIKNGLYENYIKRATHEINSNICISVFSDNAGGIIFDDNYLIVGKVETHNSPSALDPFNGAMTGVLGVNRDILGFGKGAEPIMNTYYFCFAEKEKNKFYRDKECKNKILNPKYIMKKVIHGVNVAGNCSGIPTQLGSLYFDDRFCGKPLVFVGSIGIIPRNINNTLSHIKEPKNGDIIVIIGGRVGRDGIHGATFSSKKMSGNNPLTIVQIGDPITQKKMSNFIIEARNRGLFNAITDNGAGGLSSSIGEMGKNGFEVDLSKVPLKNNNMSPWEIWISESQERMTLAVPEENLHILFQIAKKHDVEANAIGIFNNTGMSVVRFASSSPIMNIETKFLHNGNPKIHLQTKPWLKKTTTITPIFSTSTMSHQETELKEMLSRPNICSKEFIIVQYEHEVQGSSVLKQLQGKGRVCSEVIVSRPILSSKKGIVKSQGFGSSYGEIDTYHMGACAIDTAIRNYVVVGGNINHLALLDNFCWCSAYDPKRLWQLKRTAKACYDFATAFKTPFISGKDSMFNDFKGYDENGKEITISAPPSLLISAIGVIEDIENTVSLDVKMPEDLIYILGITHDELGRSEYQLYSGIHNNNVPKVNAKSAKSLYECYSFAIENGIIASAIALNLGGLAIALVKSLIAGDFGAEVDLSLVPIGKIQNKSIINEIIMFSESQSRILVTIAPQNQHKFEKLLKNKNIVFSCIGKVTEKKILNIKNILEIDLMILESSYRNTLLNNLN